MNVKKLPIKALFALFLSGFVSLLTEALPAGLLPEMSQTLHISPSLAGQTVSIYALATAIGAIPLSNLTATWSRKTVLQTALIVVFSADILTVLSSNFLLTMMIRFIAGLGTALIWPLLGGFAAAISPENQAGKATAFALAGNPVGLALGIPLGTFLGKFASWQFVFLITGILILLTIIWNFFFLPNVSGQKKKQQSKIFTTLKIPGFKPILFALITYMIAHNIVYTYITDELSSLHLSNQTSSILFAFGISSVLSVIFVGSLIDKHVRKLTLSSATGLALAMLLLTFFHQVFIIYLAAIVWGFVFGSSASLFIHSAIKATGKAADMAQAIVVTAFSGSISLGAFFGGILIFNHISITLTAFILLVLSSLTILIAKKKAFPKF